jgi:hypothetical protein
VKAMAAQLAVVAKSGLSAAELQQAIDLWTATKGGITARGKPARAKAKPRPKLDAPAAPGPASEIERKLAAAKAEALARGERGLARSIQRHLAERESVPLPEGGYTNPDDALAGARLGNNFSNLQRRLKAAGMKPLPPDDRVRDAWRLSKAFFRTADAA